MGCNEIGFAISALSEAGRWPPSPAHGSVEILLLPTAIGLWRPLDRTYPRMAEELARNGYGVRVLEFDGQHGQSGFYSVVGSIEALRRYLAAEPQRQFAAFGICTGALAALAASSDCPNLDSVFSWELSPRYDFTPENFRHLEREFELRLDWGRALQAVQADALADGLAIPTTYACSSESKCTNPEEQAGLARRSKRARSLTVEKASHVPGIPRGSESRLANQLLDHLQWVRSCMP